MPVLTAKNHDLRRLDHRVAGMARGVDMCASVGALHRVYATDTAIIHECSRDRGHTWVKEPAAGLPSEAPSEHTVPTIYCDRYNRLHVWFHNDTASYLMRAPATGAAIAGNWQRGAEIGIPPQALDRWPRGCDSMDGPCMASWSSVTGNVNFHRIQPFGSILALLPVGAAEQAIPEQLVELETDRRNRQILIWGDGSSTWARVIEGLHVPNAVEVATDGRSFLVGGYGTSRALYTFWTPDNVLASQITENNMVTVAPGPGEPPNPIFNVPGQGGLTKHHVGTTRDHFNWYWLIAQQGPTDFLHWYSPDGGRSWVRV